MLLSTDQSIGLFKQTWVLKLKKLYSNCSGSCIVKGFWPIRVRYSMDLRITWQRNFCCPHKRICRTRCSSARYTSLSLLIITNKLLAYFVLDSWFSFWQLSVWYASSLQMLPSSIHHPWPLPSSLPLHQISQISYIGLLSSCEVLHVVGHAILRNNFREALPVNNMHRHLQSLDQFQFSFIKNGLMLNKRRRQSSDR